MRCDRCGKDFDAEQAGSSFVRTPHIDDQVMSGESLDRCVTCTKLYGRVLPTLHLRPGSGMGTRK
jgi:hypothetical protein